MSPSWIRGEQNFVLGSNGEKITLAKELSHFGTRGHVIVRLGRADAWHYFQMSESEFLHAAASGKLPSPVSTDDFVSILGYSRFGGRHYVKEMILAECPRAVLQRLISAGLITNHDVMRSMGHAAL